MKPRTSASKSLEQFVLSFRKYCYVIKWAGDELRGNYLQATPNGLQAPFAFGPRRKSIRFQDKHVAQALADGWNDYDAKPHIISAVVVKLVTVPKKKKTPKKRSR